MKVLKPQQLSLLTRPFTFRGQFHFGATVITLHDLQGTLFSEQEMWPFLASQLGPEFPVDIGIPKSRSEYLVTGDAYPAGGEPVTEHKVDISVGSLRKSLNIYGDRVWQRGEAGDIEPFLSMPVDWSKAYGGDGFELNPLGIGFRPIKTETGTVRPLPNIEHPDHSNSTALLHAAPVSFGPIESEWPQRMKKAGTHDQEWLDNHYPGYPPDINWSFFNLASDDQQQNDPFEGNENFSLHGMNQDKPNLKGHLPGMNVRCFVSRLDDDEDELSELPMHLTTIWFFPNVERYVLIHHGQAEVQRDDASDIRDIMVAAETSAKTKLPDEYSQLRLQRLDPDKGASSSLEDSDLVPAALLDKTDSTEDGPDDIFQVEGLRTKYARRRLERDLDGLRAELIAQGIDPTAHVPKLPSIPDRPTPKEAQDLLETLKPEIERQRADTEAGAAEQERKLRNQLASAELDEGDHLRSSKAKPAGPPSFSAVHEEQRIRAQREQLESMGAPKEQLARLTVDEKARAKLQETELMMHDGYRKLAHQQEPAPRFEGDDAARSREAVMQSLASVGNLARLNMTGFDLSGLNLQGVDLTGAWLENANLAGANLSEANLSEAVLARADLTGAQLVGTQLPKANLGKAKLVQARFDGANLSEAILGEAILENTIFWGANLHKADLTEASFTDVDFSEATLADALFNKLDLRGTKFTGSTLTKSDFVECNVQHADFSRAHLEKVSFVETLGDEANFESAQMNKAVFVMKSSFRNCNFRRAIAQHCSFRETPLSRSDFSEAQLNGSDFSECEMHNVTMHQTSASNILMIRSDLLHANLTDSDFMNSVLQNADLRNADLRNTNLFGADLGRIHTNEMTQFAGANTNRTKTLPRRKQS